jgi:sarcosine oxidase, subunit gamma
MLAQAVVIFVSRSTDGSRVELIARTSFARYVADWLLDALADPLAYPAPHGG